MNKLIRYSGISSIALFWIVLIASIAMEITKGNGIIIHTLTTCGMLLAVVWMDRLAAFKRNLTANALSLLIWAFALISMCRALLDGTLPWVDLTVFAFIALFSAWKIVTAIFIYIVERKPETQPIEGGQ